MSKRNTLRRDPLASVTEDADQQDRGKPQLEVKQGGKGKKGEEDPPPHAKGDELGKIEADASVDAPPPPVTDEQPAGQTSEVKLEPQTQADTDPAEESQEQTDEGEAGESQQQTQTDAPADTSAAAGKDEVRHSSIKPQKLDESAEQTDEAEPMPKGRITLSMDDPVIEEARNYVLARSGPPWFYNMGKFGNEAFSLLLQLRRDEENDGKPFPPVEGALQRGRPLRQKG